VPLVNIFELANQVQEYQRIMKMNKDISSKNSTIRTIQDDLTKKSDEFRTIRVGLQALLSKYGSTVLPDDIHQQLANIIQCIEHVQDSQDETEWWNNLNGEIINTKLSLNNILKQHWKKLGEEFQGYKKQLKDHVQKYRAIPNNEKNVYQCIKHINGCKDLFTQNPDFPIKSDVYTSMESYLASIAELLTTLEGSINKCSEGLTAFLMRAQSPNGIPLSAIIDILDELKKLGTEELNKYRIRRTK